jgi:hypothetical protein
VIEQEDIDRVVEAIGMALPARPSSREEIA